MKKLRLKRVSALPNQFNNYCYVIVSGDTTGMSGIVEKDGVKLLFSFTRLGTLSAPFNADVDERKVGEKKYFNIIDTTADSVGSIAYLASIAKRAGITGNSAVDMEAARIIFGNTQSKVQSQSVAEQPVVEEEPVVSSAASVETSEEVAQAE